ncbi:MAG: Lrp/AsnC family transcriptional regulator [Myxococcota bacterium]|jgi:Lrp/AsnC family leucine-responsive transcriptional regulator
MKLNRIIPEFDALDRQILELLQKNCKQPLAAIGEEVGLSAPSVVERIHKLEQAGVITDYVALLDARRLGKDVAAFIGVSTDQPRAIGSLERKLCEIDDVLECHHVTGAYTLMVKVKTQSTEALEAVIQTIRSLEGVTRSETSVVLSTYVEHPNVSLQTCLEFDLRATGRSGKNRRRAAK